MKICSYCKKEKTLRNFSFDRNTKSGFSSYCKECKSEHDRANYLKNNNTYVAYRKQHRDKINAYNKKYYKENKRYYEKRYIQLRDRYRELSEKYRRTDEGRARTNALGARRRARRLRQTPQWADLEGILFFYMMCPAGYHVDHIIPLQGKEVSGLHVLENLQYLPPSENSRKGNKLLLTREVPNE
jgi:hypothetical protein